MKTDPREWTADIIEGAHPAGYYAIDEYGEEHGFLSDDYATAIKMLDAMIADEIAAYDEWAYDQFQERLMETGAGPSLIEQRLEAWKIKHGFKS